MLFEPLYVQHLDRAGWPKRTRDRLLREAAEERVAKVTPTNPHNVYNPKNRIRLATLEKDPLEKTFELWLSDDEDDPEAKKHCTRIIDAKEHALDTMELPAGIKRPPEGLTKAARREYKILIEDGNELAPVSLGEEGRSNLVRNPVADGFTVLNQFLHVCMLRHDWENALRIFSLLIRTYSCDIKQYWNVGVEIMRRMNDREAKPLKTLLKSQSQARGPQNGRLIRFLRFMQMTFPASRRLQGIFEYPYQVYCGSRPPETQKYMTHRHWLYRSGTKTTVPFYSYELLWQLLLSGDFVRFEQESDALYRHGGFNTDSRLQYMRALGTLIQGIKESNSEKLDDARTYFGNLGKDSEYRVDMDLLDKIIKEDSDDESEEESDSDSSSSGSDSSSSGSDSSSSGSSSGNSSGSESSSSHANRSKNRRKKARSSTSEGKGRRKRALSSAGKGKGRRKKARSAKVVPRAPGDAKDVPFVIEDSPEVSAVMDTPDVIATSEGDNAHDALAALDALGFSDDSSALNVADAPEFNDTSEIPDAPAAPAAPDAVDTSDAPEEEDEEAAAAAAAAEEDEDTDRSNWSSVTSLDESDRELNLGLESAEESSDDGPDDSGITSSNSEY